MAQLHETPGFHASANLFLPADRRCLLSSTTAQGPCPASRKKADGGRSSWNIDGHRDRIIPVGPHELALFANSTTKPGTPPLQARLPALHARQLISVLEKFAAQPRRLGDLKGDYFSTADVARDQRAEGRHHPPRDPLSRRCRPMGALRPPLLRRQPLLQDPARGLQQQQGHYDCLDLTTCPTTTCRAPTMCPPARRRNTRSARRGCRGWSRGRVAEAGDGVLSACEPTR